MKNEERKMNNEERRSDIHQCGCLRCREGGANSTRELHAELNAFLSTLEEPMRLQFLGLESMNASYGGDQQLELITGVKATMIAKVRWGMHQRRLAGRIPCEEKLAYDAWNRVTGYQTKGQSKRSG